MKTKIVVAITTLGIQACSSPNSTYPIELWDNLRLDKPVSMQQLVNAGWPCSTRPFPDEEGLDGECGPVTSPDFSVFGVNPAAASIFFRGDVSRYVNAQMHGSSARFLADNFTRLYGKPQKELFESERCSLLWRTNTSAYKLYMGDGDPAKFAALYIASSPFTLKSDTKETRFFDLAISFVTRNQCANY